MTDERQKKFKVIFSDGTEKDAIGEDVTLIYIRMLSFLLTLHKDVRVESIIDEKGGKIYGDFVWDISFSEKEKAYTTGSPKWIPQHVVEKLLLEYVQHIGGSKDFALRWFNRQTI